MTDKIPTINVHGVQVCLECHKPCHFGSGRFVNRYSGYLELENAIIEGWICGDCSAAADEYYSEGRYQNG
jgi:hypothetical protein